MKFWMAALIGGVMQIMSTGPVQAAQVPLGSDATACAPGGGPAILAQVSGLKDRKGRLKLELYPATEADFLKDDRDLVAQGKFFRRVWAEMPAAGPVQICIRVPHPGKFALFFTHDRDGKNKFNFWTDGAGLPSNHRIGMSRPKLSYAVVDVGGGTTVTHIRAQYLRSVLSGFAPLNDDN